MNKQFSSDVVTLPNNEKVIILHEDEAATAWMMIQNCLKLRSWNLTDEEDWVLVVSLKNLEEKLRRYLDNENE